MAATSPWKSVAPGWIGLCLALALVAAAVVWALLALLGADSADPDAVADARAAGPPPSGATPPTTGLGEDLDTTICWVAASLDAAVLQSDLSDDFRERITGQMAVQLQGAVQTAPDDGTASDVLVVSEFIGDIGAADVAGGTMFDLVVSEDAPREVVDAADRLDDLIVAC